MVVIKTQSVAHLGLPSSSGNLRVQIQVHVGGAASSLPGPALLHLSDGGQRAEAAGPRDPPQHHRPARQPRQAARHQVADEPVPTRRSAGRPRFTADPFCFSFSPAGLFPTSLR